MTITASEFKAKCLRLMEHVRDTGESVSITKRGVEVARLTPAQPREEILRSLRGSVRIHGDIVSSLFRDEDFDASTGRELRHGQQPKRGALQVPLLTLDRQLLASGAVRSWDV